MAYIGDLAHHPVLLMEKPLTEFAYDTDPKQSAQTRVRLLNMLASNKTPIVAYHFRMARHRLCRESRGWLPILPISNAGGLVAPDVPPRRCAAVPERNICPLHPRAAPRVEGGVF
jgi:hypothetical protein